MDVDFSSKVQAVPWPYTSKEQFDKTHCTPVGRHWNTENTFQHMIKPRVTVHSGEFKKRVINKKFYTGIFQQVR